MYRGKHPASIYNSADAGKDHRGRHFCVGAALARMELEALVSVLTQAWESIELEGVPAGTRCERQTSADRGQAREVNSSNRMIEEVKLLANHFVQGNGLPVGVFHQAVQGILTAQP
jgi:hypothetical protein